MDRLDSSGNILATYAFDSYGLRTGTDNSSDPYSYFEGEFGYYEDSESGLELLTHRYYDPGAGRFLNRDPIGTAGGINIYRYADNNPISEVDPSGYDGLDANSAYSYWMNVAQNGISAGGVAGNAKAAGASVMTGVIDFFNARQIQNDSAASGTAAGCGKTAEALKDGAKVAGQILLAATPGLGGEGKAASEIVEAGSSLTAAKSAIGATGKIGEDALATLGGEGNVYRRTDLGKRYLDRLVKGFAHESKVGYTSLTKVTRLQIAKDAELMGKGDIKGATWQFFPSPVTGLGGPSGPLRQALESRGIQIIIH